MTVQDLIDWCEEHNQSPEYTDIEVYANSSLGWTHAVFASEPWGGVSDSKIYLDYC